jgi:cobalt-zinc-cadmium efflux system outer membrane protein
MMRSTLLALASLVCVLAHACKTPSREEIFDDVRADLAERGIERVHWDNGTQADEEAADAVHELLQHELNADAAVQIALLNNRELQATFEELGVARADLVAAGLLANPVFHGEIRFPGHPKNPLELDVSQDFLSVFLLPLRKRVAKAELDAVKLHVAQAVLDLARDTRAAFYELQAAQQSHEMHSNIVAALEASADTAQRLRDAGNITELELANQRAELARGQLELAAAEEEVNESRERLSMLLGVFGDDTEFSVASRLPGLPNDEPGYEEVESVAVSRRLDLAAARAEVEAAANVLGIERYAALAPGVDITWHTEREPEGLTTSGPGIEIPIPIFGQGQAARERALSQLRQREHHFAALAVEIRSDVRRLRFRMLSARNRVEYYRATVLPLRGQIVDETQLSYNGMLVGIFQLLEAKRAEIDAGRAWIEAQRDYWIARTELERAVGAPLALADAPESSTPQPPPNEPPPAEHHHEHGD